MSAQKEDLAKFRQQIDAIDDKIIALLKERLSIVKEVGKYKSQHSTTQSFIRAGREANMLRDLTRKIDGQFPPAAIATIWRMIISTSLATEQAMSICAYATDTDQTCYWHAREYYGSFIRTTRAASTDEVVRNVASGKASIGILPLEDRSATPWWVRPSEEKNDVYIFARIPFIESPDTPDYPTLAIANVMPEATEDDQAVLSVHTTLSAEALQEAFGRTGISCYIVANHNTTDYLITTHRFIAPGDPLVATLQSHLPAGSSVRLMGAYAVPMASHSPNTH